MPRTGYESWTTTSEPLDPRTSMTSSMKWPTSHSAGGFSTGRPASSSRSRPTCGRLIQSFPVLTFAIRRAPRSVASLTKPSIRSPVHWPRPRTQRNAPPAAAPMARRHVVVAEALVEGLAQDGVRFERDEGTLERTGQLPHVAAGIRVSDDRLGRRELALDAIRDGRGDGRDSQVRIGVGPGPAALEAAQLGVVGAHDGPHGAGAVLDPPRRVDRRKPTRHQPLVRVDGRIE